MFISWVYWSRYRARNREREEGAMEVFLHEVTIHVPGGPITTVAGFSDQVSLACLLGMLGFFEHFNIVFDPLNLRVELERLFRA